MSNIGIEKCHIAGVIAKGQMRGAKYKKFPSGSLIGGSKRPDTEEGKILVD